MVMTQEKKRNGARVWKDGQEVTDPAARDEALERRRERLDQRRLLGVHALQIERYGRDAEVLG